MNLAGKVKFTEIFVPWQMHSAGTLMCDDGKKGNFHSPQTDHSNNGKKSAMMSDAAVIRF